MLNKPEMDNEVTRVIERMRELEPETEEYKNAAESLRTLCEARGVKSSSALSPEMIVATVTNIFGILLILNYEHLHVVTSKALAFIKR